MSHEGAICLVTGARRGVGRGIALALASQGATVYITGRSMDRSGPDDPYPGLGETAAEVASRGGACIPVVCDHADHAQTRLVFERIAREQEGRLDLLVNNAIPCAEEIRANAYVPFWVQPLEIWERVRRVAIDDAYLCAVLAAQLMAPREAGLIVNLSAAYALRCEFSAPQGICKEAIDRMAEDCARDLYPAGVAFVSLWPGFVSTESLVDYAQVGPEEDLTDPSVQARAALHQVLETSAESPEFVGRCVAGLLADPRRMEKSGRILVTADLADEYGLRLEGGRRPQSVRQLNRVAHLLNSSLAPWLSWLPDFLRLPMRLLNMLGKDRYR